jgi:hypothetical protein
MHSTRKAAQWRRCFRKTAGIRSSSSLYSLWDRVLAEVRKNGVGSSVAM